MWGRHMFRIIMLIVLAATSLGCMRSACSLNYIKSFRAKDVGLPVATKWKKNPVVQVCDTAPVTKDEVEMVLAEWAAHGAPKLKVVESKCEDEVPAPGFLQIDQWRPDWRGMIPGAHAVTAVWPQLPEAGLIMVPDSNIGVLRHELGHIWLHGHANRDGHVLCPYVDCIGDNWDGVRRAFRKGGF